MSGTKRQGPEEIRQIVANLRYGGIMKGEQFWIDESKKPFEETVLSKVAEALVRTVDSQERQSLAMRSLMFPQSQNGTIQA
jgi:hypothetical protein